MSPDSAFWNIMAGIGVIACGLTAAAIFIFALLMLFGLLLPPEHPPADRDVQGEGE